mmetsp:Transcript_23033/g.64369  ORF Transcript_23033/g.64369 Transcript_23033/m.64369 type:complete len:200 (+) Transcript_23033:337-936(+)|eukprot:CAMPEP_0177399092 /NCGR_PEP_ID=MMETSP0368-20130122/58281_1 /TAXON_ID=447022 ORGANISM="Scrippsiella hangoei-like, Strain SHHI-4" /NCGR_SAMPLE_ID=MMETSP0368 /ASSEMBLY_ACC=CAM_ASM_000363 /LENGTH=199 /DNA_ID=CAMNT_0018866281 /DNA_START=286 /DNA_END=885 /DNA_ORIENTATION=+
MVWPVSPLPRPSSEPHTSNQDLPLAKGRLVKHLDHGQIADSVPEAGAGSGGSCTTSGTGASRSGSNGSGSPGGRGQRPAVDWPAAAAPGAVEPVLTAEVLQLLWPPREHDPRRERMPDDRQLNPPHEAVLLVHTLPGALQPVGSTRADICMGKASTLAEGRRELPAAEALAVEQELRAVGFRVSGPALEVRAAAVLPSN